MTDPGYSLKLTIPRLDVPDFYASMSGMNMASLVMLHENGIVQDELAARIAAATRMLVDREALPGATRSHDYLDFERELLLAVGPEASWLHVGRSRQDMLSTGVSLWLCAAHLALFDDLLTVRQPLLDFAAQHTETIVPIYTHGVQAQPTTLAHYLLGILAGLERTAVRVTESYARTNRSPLGAGAGTTSAFVIDRPRLAELLGFDGVTDNAFDANLVAPIDSTLEFAQILSTVAVQVGQLISDLLAQFYLVDSWFALDAGSSLTGISSMMPQKRNPRVLEVLREHASIIIGAASSMTLLAHNVTSGMTDVRETVTSVVPLPGTHDMLFLVARTFEAARVDPVRSLAEVNRDYSAMTNLAEVLVQSARVPFREAHEYASRLTDFGRQRGLRPPEVAFADAAALYREHIGAALPLSEAEAVAYHYGCRKLAAHVGYGRASLMKTRLILTDDHEVLRQGLRALLEGQPDLEVVGEASDGQETLELVRNVRPDMVLMDLIMPGVDGITTTQRLHDEFPDVRVLILSSIDEEAAVVAAVRAGAIGYVRKNTSIEILLETIRAAARGQVQFSAAAAARLVREVQAPLEQPEHLTPRELEVLQHVADGLANKEIAWKLRISEKTVKSHVSTILDKFGLDSRTQAAMYAARIGLVAPQPTVLGAPQHLPERGVLPITGPWPTTRRSRRLQHAATD